MEHDQRVCPRCGEPAGVYSFCQSCRSHMDSLTGIPTSAAAHAGDGIYPATRALREVVRLEEALAAASKGISERIAATASAAAVEVDPDPLAASAETVHAPRDVARLEDVLTIAPTADNDSIAAASASIAPPAPAQTQADGNATVEQVESPPRVEEQPAEPTYLAAARLREAFWFEQASAFKPAAAADPITRQAPEPVAAAVSPAPKAADSSQSAQSGLPEGGAEPAGEDTAAPSLLELWLGRARTTWPAAVWLVALVALFVLLTGRKQRRFI